ncbi:MAG: DNA primase [Alkaliphilus sp.]
MKNFFSDEMVQKIQENNEIVNLVASYLDLKVSGNSHKALCPFHNEKTASFTVNQEKQIFKCFGCGEAGNVINFVMKIENLDFVDALKLLAERANIAIENTSISDKEREIINKKTMFYEINKIAGEYFYHKLTKEKNQAIHYLNKRGLKARTINSFGIGYSLDSWNDLMDYLISKGFSVIDIQECGLIRQSTNSSANAKQYDSFRDRIMFPIFDIRGKVVGFGGRALDNTLPKYINSPETIIFSKSNILYALNIARKNIRDRRIILVEGYMDVIVLNQEGIKNAVATLGTSLTKTHAQILKKYCDEVIICFDSDDAGKKATLRSIDILYEAGLDVKISVLENGMDPDDYIRLKGRQEFNKLVDMAMGKIDYTIRMAKLKFNLLTSDGKIRFIREMTSSAKRLKNPVEIELFLKKIEKEVGVSYEAIRQEMLGNDATPLRMLNKRYTSRINRNNKYITPIPLADRKGGIIAEKELIRIILHENESVINVFGKLDPEDFTVKDHKRIIEYLYYNYDNFDINAMINEIPSINKAVQEIMKMDIQHTSIKKNVEEYIKTIKINSLEGELKVQQKLLEDINKHSKKEDEDKLLENEIVIGMRMQAINTKIQKLRNEVRKEGI